MKHSNCKGGEGRGVVCRLLLLPCSRQYYMNSPLLHSRRLKSDLFNHPSATTFIPGFLLIVEKTEPS